MKTLLFTVFISCLSLGFSQAKSDAIVGYWNTGENSSITEIYKQGNKYYGRLAYVVEASREKLDFKNPDASKRSRKILGLTFLENFVFDADDDEWEDGKIYNIQDGKSYSAYMELKDANTLKLTGYIGVRMLGQTRTWTRVSATDIKLKLGK